VFSSINDIAPVSWARWQSITAGLPVAVNRGQLHCQWRCHRHC